MAVRKRGANDAHKLTRGTLDCKTTAVYLRLDTVNDNTFSAFGWKLHAEPLAANGLPISVAACMLIRGLLQEASHYR